MTTTQRTKVSRGSLEQENLFAVQEEKIEMTLNTDNAIAQGLLIQRLTELYEDPIEATVRETVSNGLDATAVACSGDTPKIEIETPTQLNPVFVVRDNGVGMSYEDLKNVYSKYGASTKMDNFDQIGAYGLGAKAPLAYGTQFTVSSVREGVKTTIVVVREELTNYIRVIETGPTDEPSGTTVSVPVANNDIAAFTSHIDKYKDSPVDYKGEIYINGAVVKDDKFALIDEEVVVFDENGEKVTARMWFEINKDRIVNLITSLNENDFLRNLKLVIGGWKYDSPNGRNQSYYRNSSASVIVELKPGLVSFNSARDAVLMNERFKKFEAHVIKYVKSEAFLEKMVKTVNSLEIETFKSVVMTLLQRSLNNITLDDDNNLQVQAQSSSYSFMHNFKLSDFVHEESGFNFTYITKGVPKTKKETAVLAAHKYGYRTTMEYSVFRASQSGAVDRIQRYRSTDALDHISNVLEGSYATNSLASFMLVNAINSYADKNKGKNIISIVTDLVVDEDKKSSYKKVLSGRKTIIEMRNTKNLESFEAAIVFTMHTKAEMEKMVKDAMLDNLEIIIKTADEVAEEISEYRKSNRSAGTGTRNVNTDFTAQVYKISDKKNDTNRIQFSEVDFTKKAVFVASRERYISGQELQELANGYSNANNIKPEEFNLYGLVGNLRVIEMNMLIENQGEIYEYQRSTDAGTSNLYRDTVKGKHIQPSVFCKLEEGLAKKSFIRLVSGLTYENPRSAFNTLADELSEMKEVFKLFGVELKTPDNIKMAEIGEYGIKEFGESYSNSYWSLNESYKKQLLTTIEDEMKDTIELVSLIANRANRYSNEQIYVDGENMYMANNTLNTLIPTKEFAEKLANSKSPLANVTKITLEAFAKEFNPKIEKLSSLA